MFAGIILVPGMHALMFSINLFQVNGKTYEQNVDTEIIKVSSSTSPLRLQAKLLEETTEK